MRNFVTLTAPVVFRGDSDPNIGVYGIEGSKPGAAAVSCLLSHRVIGRRNLFIYPSVYNKCISTFLPSVYSSNNKSNTIVLSIYLSIYLSLYLSISLYIYLSIYLSMYPGREGCYPGILYNWYETLDGNGSGIISIYLSIYVSR